MGLKIGIDNLENLKFFILMEDQTIQEEKVQMTNYRRSFWFVREKYARVDIVKLHL